MAKVVSVKAEVGHNERVDAQVGHHVIVMDQPEDSGGEDLGPSPVEVFVASVAACTVHYLRVACRRHDVDASRLTVDAVAIPSTDAPARLGTIQITCHLPGHVPDELKKRLISTAESCYLARTILRSPDIELQLQCGSPTNG
ncbi:MAG: OsmC family protein [Planctomycetota bacterium]